MIKKLLIVATIIAIVGISFIGIYHDKSVVTYVEDVEINFAGKTYYLLKYNFGNYLLGIKNAVIDPTILKINPIPQQWMTPTGSWLEPDFWEAILNNLEYMLNFGIFISNIFLYPLRICTYVGRIVLSIFGINRNAETIKWIYDLLEFFYGQLPYLQH